MIEENEAIMFILGLAILVRLLTNYAQTRRIPAFQFLFISFLSFLGATMATIMEGFFWENILNLLEHLLYLTSQVSLAIWVWKICKNSEGEVKTQ